MTSTLVAFSISWPAASIAIAFLVFLTVAAASATWGTGRAAILGDDRADYRALAERIDATLNSQLAMVDRMATDVTDVRTRLAEVERLLKEV